MTAVSQRSRRAAPAVTATFVLVAGVAAVTAVTRDEPSASSPSQAGRRQESLVAAKGATDADTSAQLPGLPARCAKAPDGSITDSLGAIAYVRDGELHRVGVRSHRDRVLVRGRKVDDGFTVRWSSDGRWISFGPGYVVRAVGGRVRSPLGRNVVEAVWSPSADVLVAQTRRGGLVRGGPGRPRLHLLPAGWGVTSFAFDCSGRFVAVGRARFGANAAPVRARDQSIWVVDVFSGARERIYRATKGIAPPEVASWSPDGRWILFWPMEHNSASLTADGAPLDAAPVAGGRPRRIVDAMLPYQDFLTWCGDTLVVSAGAGRQVTVGKRLVAATAPDWRAEPLVRDRQRSVFWPDCSPDGKEVAATVTRNRYEARFGTLRRYVQTFDLGGSPSAGWGADSSGVGASAEYPLYSRNQRPHRIAVLYVERTGDGRASIYFRTGKPSYEIAGLGRVDSYYGHYPYSDLFDWYQRPR